MPRRRPLAVENWPWPFRMETLGECRVLAEDRALRGVARLRQKPIDLLKALVALGPDGVTEARVAQALWSRIDAEYAQRSLSTNLHRLRKSLGVDRSISLRNGRLSLDPNWWWLDAWARSTPSPPWSAPAPSGGADRPTDQYFVYTFDRPFVLTIGRRRAARRTVDRRA